MTTVGLGFGCRCTTENVPQPAVPKQMSCGAEIADITDVKPTPQKTAVLFDRLMIS
jgi:hypothetical protein